MMHPSSSCDPHPRHLFQRVTGTLWEDCGTKIEQEKDDKKVSLTDELDLYRLLLAQLRSADPASRSTLSRNLTFLIVRESGLRKLLTSTFDFDESSQHVTTLDQRCQAMANLIAAPPVICCPLSQYFQQLSDQIHSLMKNDPTLPASVRVFVNKLCALTVNSMMTRNRKLALKTFVRPLISSLSSPGSPLTPQNCIDVICGLAMTDFDLSLLIEAFPACLFALFVLDDASSTRKQPLSLAISELLKRVDNSLYLLDDSLFNHYSSHLRRFRATLDATGTSCIVFEEDSSDEQINIQSHDKIISSIMDLISGALSEENQVDFCLLLLERLSFRHLMSPDCALLLYSLIAALIERIEPLFCKFPVKWIRFIRETVNRFARDCESNEMTKSSCSSRQASSVTSIPLDTIEVVMQILQIIVNERSMVDEKDVGAIRDCISTMLKCQKASAMHNDIISLLSELDENKDAGKEGDFSVRKGENFQEALRDLNDPLMPTRAHGLICLKRLILAGDASVLQNWKRVLQLLEICLADGESYIYLSAINTLAALCLSKTDHTLPILLQAYENEDRTIQERLNVAEVIARVSRSLEGSPSKYSQLFLQTFMHSLKDPDEMIRVSTLSNMGYFCARMGSEIDPYLGEIFHTVYSLIRNDDSLLVRRASLLMLHLTLTGIDGQSFETIQKYGKRIHSLIQEAYTHDPDDVSRLHAQLALEEMERIAGERIYLLSKSASHNQIK